MPSRTRNNERAQLAPADVRLGLTLLVATIAFLLTYVGPSELQSQTWHYVTFLRSHFVHIAAPVDVLDPIARVTYRGVVDKDVEHFQNIFYARDTSGQNRFAPPVRYVPTPGSIVDATAAGAWCPQSVGDVLPFTSPVTNISENCLSLRIARPKGTQRLSRLPVVVFLHGGGHALGSGSDVLYTPDGFVQHSAALNQPVVYVAINYRLGFFGFATSSALRKQKHTNAGLRDQRSALEWVKEHIAIFGGDPNKITAIGQSVGASDIGLHLTSYNGQKGVPFKRAVMMSGAPGLNFNIKSEAVTENTAAVANQVGCVSSPADHLEASTNALDCLRRVSLEELANASVTMMKTVRPPFGEGLFQPIYDDDIITDYPSESMRRSRVVKGIPLIAGWQANDGAWYAPPTTTTDEEVTASVKLWMQGLSEESLARLLQLYPLEDFAHLAPAGSPISPQYFRAAQMNRDLWFTCPVLDFTWQYARQNGASNVRLYEMNQTRYAPVLEIMGVPFWKVVHLSDIPYVFNVQDLPGGIDSSQEQLALARHVSSRIIAFVNGKEDSDWTPAYLDDDVEANTGDHPKQMKLNVFGGPFGNDMISTSRSGVLHSDGQHALAHEKLFARCELINSEKVRREVGV